LTPAALVGHLLLLAAFGRRKRTHLRTDR
jgi:hypothetical protein